MLKFYKGSKSVLPKLILYIKTGVNISHKNWNFSGTASENFKTFPDNCQESRWAGKHHVLHDAFRSTATCRGSSLFFFLICQIRIPKFLETLQDFVPLFSRNSQNCSKKSPNSKTIPSQLWQNNDKYLPLALGFPGNGISRK